MIKEHSIKIAKETYDRLLMAKKKNGTTIKWMVDRAVAIMLRKSGKNGKINL